MIEKIGPKHSLYQEYLAGDFNTKVLKFEKWIESMGVAITSGMRQHEFVSRTKNHLIGIRIKDFGQRGKIDQIGAETILEEMYDDSQVKPSVVTPQPTGDDDRPRQLSS